MKNSGASNIVLERHLFCVGDSSLRFDGTFSDRTNYMKMRCTFGIENDLTMMLHRQQQVLQAPAATCSVDSTSHESVTDSKSDLGTYCAYDSNISANCALVSEFTLRESQINNSQLGDKPVAASTTKPRRFETWKINIKLERKTREKRRRRKQ